MIQDRIAPPGKFRVLGVDRFDNEHYIVGDFDTMEEATSVARLRAKHPNGSPGLCDVYYVYDDTGAYLGDGLRERMS